LVNGRATRGFESLLEKQYLLIIPRIGCMGCISSVEMLMLDVYDEHEDKLNILLSDITSYKTARVKFGLEFLKAPNVFVDRKNYFSDDPLPSMYPQIFKLDNGEITHHWEVSPENENALANLAFALNQ